MRKALHKYFTFLLLLAIASPSLLFVYFSTELLFIRHQMEEQLEHQHLQTLELKKAELKWHKKGKEIEIGDRLFDIKEIKEKGELVIVKGLFDDEEKKIKKRIGLLEKQKNDENQLSHQVILKFATAQLYFESPGTEFTPSLRLLTTSLVIPTALCISPFQRIPIPPPRA